VDERGELVVVDEPAHTCEYTPYEQLLSTNCSFTKCKHFECATSGHGSHYRLFKDYQSLLVSYV